MEGKEESYISIEVQARARKRAVERVGPSEYKVSVISPASKGKANKEVVTTLASYFDLPPSRIKIMRGTKSPRKKILIEVEKRRVSGEKQPRKSG